MKGTVLVDLDAINDGLVPFRERTLKEFADFLIRAEQYYASGEVPWKPAKGKKAAQPTKAGKAKSPAPAPRALAQEAEHLYEHAADPAVTVEMVHELVEQLEKLTKEGVLVVAAAVQLKFAKSASKGAMVQAIQRRILDRKGSSQRAGLLDRPTAPKPPHAEPEAGVTGMAQPATTP